MIDTRRCLPNLVLGIVCCAIFGCGTQGRPVYEVVGTVSYNGKPLPAGHISFDPADGAGSAQSAAIHEGKFSLQVEAGPKRVEIRANRVSTRPGPDGKPDFEQYLPPKFNTHTTLTADVIPQRNELRLDLDDAH